MSHIDPRHIHISDYNYPLPDERIAKFPIAQRDHSKLLIYNKGEVSSDVFYNLPQYLPHRPLRLVLSGGQPEEMERRLFTT